MRSDFNCSKHLPSLKFRVRESVDASSVTNIDIDRETKMDLSKLDTLLNEQKASDKRLCMLIGGPLDFIAIEKESADKLLTFNKDSKPGLID